MEDIDDLLYVMRAWVHDCKDRNSRRYGIGMTGLSVKISSLHPGLIEQKHHEQIISTGSSSWWWNVPIVRNMLITQWNNPSSKEKVTWKILTHTAFVILHWSAQLRLWRPDTVCKNSRTETVRSCQQEQILEEDHPLAGQWSECRICRSNAQACRS